MVTLDADAKAKMNLSQTEQKKNPTILYKPLKNGNVLPRLLAWNS